MWGHTIVLLSYAFATDVCGSLKNPSNFSSVSTMEANGWEFSWDDGNTAWPTGFCDGFDPPNYYCGFEYPGHAELSLLLELSGYENGWLEINYGGNYNNKETSLYLNDALVDTASVVSQIFGVAFEDGDLLKVTEELTGVIIISDIEFSCSFAPSIVPSVPPTLSPTASPTTTTPPSVNPSVSPTVGPTTIIPTVSPSIIAAAPARVSNTELTVLIGVAVAFVMVTVVTCTCLLQIRRDICTIKKSMILNQMPAGERDEVAMSVLPSSKMGEEGYIDSTL